MPSEGFIETGVDKLVKLVENKKKISTVEAAKTLGVSPAVIDEWADFLEEEGIISIEYKLATTYLCERKLSKKEVVKKAKEFHGSKEAFIRKIETSISGIGKDTEGLEQLKEEFKKLKDDIGHDLEHVKDELKELEEYERLKKNIDKQMQKQQTDFKSRIKEMDKEMLKEKGKYKELLSDIEVEKIKIEEEKSDILSLKGQEAKLLGKLDDFKEMIKQIRKAILQEESKVDITEDHIKYLDKIATKVGDNIVKEREKIDPLVKETHIQEEQILETQEEIVKKVVQKRKEIAQNVEESTHAADKFKKFFEQKSEVEKLIKKVDQDKELLQQELAELIKKAHAFDLASKKSDVKKYITELNAKFKQIEKKREKFKKEINKLINLIKRNF